MNFLCYNVPLPFNFNNGNERRKRMKKKWRFPFTPDSNIAISRNALKRRFKGHLAKTNLDDMYTDIHVGIHVGIQQNNSNKVVTKVFFTNIS